MRRARIPVVLLDCDIFPFPDRSEYDVVGVNDVEAGAKIARHLVDDKKLRSVRDRYGDVVARTVLYCGTNADLPNGVRYRNVNEFLKNVVLFWQSERESRARGSQYPQITMNMVGTCGPERYRGRHSGAYAVGCQGAFRLHAQRPQGRP